MSSVSMKIVAAYKCKELGLNTCPKKLSTALKNLQA